MHETAEEAKAETEQMLKVYADFCENSLAIPVIKGRKTDKEKFAGAEATYTIEAMMHDGKALQSGTSHYFGDGFAKAFDITFTGRDNSLCHPFQTSWGMSTRVIHYFDLKNPDILASPYFYLQQDDVVYVTPNKYLSLIHIFCVRNLLSGAYS